MKKQLARITIPVNPTVLILLLVAIKAQHEKMGKNSPLNALDWGKFGSSGKLVSEMAKPLELRPIGKPRPPRRLEEQNRRARLPVLEATPRWTGLSDRSGPRGAPKMPAQAAPEVNQSAQVVEFKQPMSQTPTSRMNRKFASLIDEAAQVDTKLTQCEKDVEKLSGRRTALVDSSLTEFARSCRDVLTGVFRGDLRQMIDFGFEVDDTPRAKKKTTEDAQKKSA